MIFPAPSGVFHAADEQCPRQSLLGRVSVWAVQPRAPQSSPRGGGGVSASPPAKPALLYPVPCVKIPVQVRGQEQLSTTEAFDHVAVVGYSHTFPELSEAAPGRGEAGMGSGCRVGGTQWACPFSWVRFRLRSLNGGGNCRHGGAVSPVCSEPDSPNRVKWGHLDTVPPAARPQAGAVGTRQARPLAQTPQLWARSRWAPLGGSAEQARGEAL